MEKIRIKFCDFWGHWNMESNFIVNALKKKYDVEISDNPDYIFFSNFNERFEHMDYNDCVKIFYTQEDIVPDFNYADYGIGYEYMEYGDRYFRYPIFLIPERYGDAWNRMKNKHLNVDDNALKRKFCSFVVSNVNGDIIRKQYYDMISKYKKIDSGGRFLNNMPDGKCVENKDEFASQYKFSLCFENSSHPGYTTEKIVEAFASGTVPIYWGDPKITELFNPKAFINANEYESVNELLEKIKEIDSNDELYMNMLKEPALTDEKYAERTREEFENFLYAIFDRDKDKAIRRNRIFWGDIYHQRYKRLRDYYYSGNGTMIKKVINKARKIFS